MNALHLVLLMLGSEPNPPNWPASVQVFGPSSTDIEAKVQAAFAENGGHEPSNHGQFSESRFAFLFKPGSYTEDVPVGYYTQILGLGSTPTEVVFTGAKGVFCEEGDFSIGGALSTFWRGAENFQSMATTAWSTGTGMMWAVSQAAPLRRINIDNDLVLFEYEPPIPGAGEASGGFMANVQVGGLTGGGVMNANTNRTKPSALSVGVKPGSQQQWFSRNSEVAAWAGGVWNMVFAGVKGAPPSHCGDTPQGQGPYTTATTTPLVAEKPFITVDASGNKFNLIVPAPKSDSSGVDFVAPTAAETIGFENVYVTQTTDGAKEINAKLSAGLNVVVSPGIYQLTAPLVLSHPNQVLLGLGMATLVAAAQTPVIAVGDVDGVRVAGFLMQAGPPAKDGSVSPSLLQWGTSGTYPGKEANPCVISDVFARVGGPDGGASSPVGAGVMVNISSGFVVFDNTWLWRADHTVNGAADYTDNKVDHGLVVSGDNVHAYGMAVEHTLKDLTIWSGESGQTYFYQSELPYCVSEPEFGTPGYAGYRVTPEVKQHRAYGVGVYCFFNKFVTVTQSGIVCPEALVSSFVNPLSVWLNGMNGSGIVHVINQHGATAGINSTTTGANYYCGGTV